MRPRVIHSILFGMTHHPVKIFRILEYFIAPSAGKSYVRHAIGDKLRQHVPYDTIIKISDSLKIQWLHNSILLLNKKGWMP